MNIVRDQAALAAQLGLEGPRGLALLEKVSSRELDPFSAAAELFR